MDLNFGLLLRYFVMKVLVRNFDILVLEDKEEDGKYNGPLKEKFIFANLRN